MNCCRRRLRRTAPASSRSRNELVPASVPKVNGWSCPPHIFQLIGWMVYIYMVIVGFGIYIPLLPSLWKLAAYSLIAIAFTVHLVAHIAAVSIDPAHTNVRTKIDYTKSLPFFDRNKQPHVIHNLHCYLCDVQVGPEVKHCGVCHKCVENFDHHCKWLNTCVGGRNYWYFFVTLLSATLGVSLLLMVISFIFIQHYMDPASLRTAPQFDTVVNNGTWLVFLPLVAMETSSVAILVVAFVTILILLICLLLLGHLLGFHFYILANNMSTYDYIMKQRQKEASKRDVEAGISKHSNNNGKGDQNPETSVDCEASLSHSVGTCKYEEKREIASRLSESICTELKNVQKLSNKENSIFYGTELPMNDAPGFRLAGGQGGQCVEQPGGKSVEGVPIIHNSLGSSVMEPEGAHL
ncbi:palmitoyltransferase ZDHHC11 isoform X3 [Hypomesus transpacificus]|uniref:palmitoyltransferase ZDHHC11 isoform X3 n=1 Tax=Hypomesus transpacificus TaxID=137520 RepID=UPI001F0846CC|nr:palmitoyltransferase ZDHHC11 isoform X3 [Hypomesus transpacificus]